MSDLSPLDWTALRDFLAVAEAGSLSAAARRLGVSQPTLTRRMAALEDRFQTELFLRSPRGLALTEAGESMLEPARQMEQEVQAIELCVSGRDRTLAGPVRITATEGLAVHWMTPQLAAFQAAHPAIELQLLVQNTVLDILRREADIAVRLGRPKQADLVGRKVAQLRFGLYASRDYLERSGRPRSREDLARHRGVAFDESLNQRGVGAWLEELLEPASIAFRSNSLLAQHAAIRSGWGIGGQAGFMIEADPDVEPVLPELGIDLDIWLVTHAGLRRSARIRAVFDFLAERFGGGPLSLGDGHG